MDRRERIERFPLSVYQPGLVTANAEEEGIPPGREAAGEGSFKFTVPTGFERPLTGIGPPLKIAVMTGSLAFLGFPSGPELIVLLVVGLILFGGKLPEVGKSIGRGLMEFRKGLRGLKDETGISELESFRDELRDDVQEMTRLPDEADFSVSEDLEEQGGDDESQPEAGKDGEGTPPPFGYRS